MSRRLKRRINDGAYTGIKQDRFRNSKFERDENRGGSGGGGVMRKTLNTLGGAYEENRGRRNASERLNRRDDNPFENGRVYNWGRRKGWDPIFDKAYDRNGGRAYGGGQLDHDGSHFGKGPRGYKRADEDIYEDVCQALTLSPAVDASDVEVSVKDGIVYLQGSVESREAKRMAEFAIENVSGVHDVQNGLNFERGEQRSLERRPRPEEGQQETRQ